MTFRLFFFFFTFRHNATIKAVFHDLISLYELMIQIEPVLVSPVLRQLQNDSRRELEIILVGLTEKKKTTLPKKNHFIREMFVLLPTY